MWIIAYFFLHFAIYLTFRVLFLVWNWPSLQFLTKSQLLSAFVTGLRFDTAAIVVTAGTFILGLLWFQKNKLIRWVWIFTFWILFLANILLNCVDTELVNFTGRRFSKSAFFLIGEGHVTNFIFPYINIASFTLLFLLVVTFAIYYLMKKMVLTEKLSQKLMISFVLIITMIIGFRGGLQSKPISFVEGHLFSETIANQLVLNSTFTVLKSLNKSSSERLHFFSEAEMLDLLKNNYQQKKISTEFNNINVVLIILESFSLEYTQLKNPEFTPFLNRLMSDKNAVSLKNAYANGLRSIEGVGAVLAGVPALMEEPFINSEFAANQFIGIGSVLKAKGYHTSFFHGAQNGSMHFDAFIKSTGIEHYFGKNEYPNIKDDDGTWGIYDGPFLNWACDKISTFPQPFMTSVFTLSSHQPFNIPENVRSEHPDGPIPILKAIHYTDSSLESFLNCAKQKPWFKNTLFIITADHAGPALNTAGNFASRFRIPIIFFSNEKNRLENLDSDQYAQQIDLLPTIFDTVGIQQKSKNLMARSLWQPGYKQIALYADGVYDLVGDISDKDLQLKAIRQYFSQGLFDNKLYYPVLSQ